MRPLAALLAALLLAGPARADDFGQAKVGAFQRSGGSSGADGDRDAARALVNKQIAKINAAPKGSLADPGVGDDAKQRLAAVDGCERAPFNGANPDDSTSWTCGGDIYSVMTYGKGSTSRRSNAGMLKYDRASVLASEPLYQAGFLFYSDLKDLDLNGRASPGDAGGAGIQDKASKNLLQLAREKVRMVTGKDDRLMAMRVLALYGHDNRFNYLTAGSNNNSCQLKLLDAVKPNGNSNLYLNGALGREYWSDDVDRAVKINNDCVAAASGHSVERDMCGEYTSYQADYYHVIQSAFLFCHCLATSGSVINSMSDGLQRDAYLWTVAKYKSDRFDEEIAAAQKEAGRTPAVDLLAKAWKEKGGLGMSGSWKLVCDSSKASTCLDKAGVDSWDWNGWCSQVAGCGAAQIAIAKALMKRYVFELNFRVDQHFMGIQVANFDLKCSK